MTTVRRAVKAKAVARCHGCIGSMMYPKWSLSTAISEPMKTTIASTAPPPSAAIVLGSRRTSVMTVSTVGPSQRSSGAVQRRRAPFKTLMVMNTPRALANRHPSPSSGDGKARAAADSGKDTNHHMRMGQPGSQSADGVIERHLSSPHMRKRFIATCSPGEIAVGKPLESFLPVRIAGGAKKAATATPTTSKMSPG